MSIVQCDQNSFFIKETSPILIFILEFDFLDFLLNQVSPNLFWNHCFVSNKLRGKKWLEASNLGPKNFTEK